MTILKDCIVGLFVVLLSGNAVYGHNSLQKKDRCLDCNFGWFYVIACNAVTCIRPLHSETDSLPYNINVSSSL